MRIAAFADVHGNLPALTAVLDDIHRESPDISICLGDLAFKGPCPGECIELLMKRAVQCVYGNTDRALLRVAGLLDDNRPVGAALPYLEWHLARMSGQALHFLSTLPFECRLDADAVRLLFVHATPEDVGGFIGPFSNEDDARRQVRVMEADWLVMGHLHDPYYFRFGSRRLVNTGAVGFSLDGNWRPSYALIDTRTETVAIKRIGYNVEEAVTLARERDFCFDPDWYGSALRQGYWDPVPYDRRAAIDRFPR